MAELEKTLNEYRGMLSQARQDAATHQEALKVAEAQVSADLSRKSYPRAVECPWHHGF